MAFSYLIRDDGAMHACTKWSPPFFSTVFPMFVPSLSGQNDRRLQYKMAQQKERFLHTVEPLAFDRLKAVDDHLVALFPLRLLAQVRGVQRVAHLLLCRDATLVLSAFPCVCPESVLVK